MMIDIQKPKQEHMVIKFILIFVVSMWQEMIIYNENLLQSFLLIIYLCMKTNIIFKYI